jgi:hypothetical protein
MTNKNGHAMTFEAEEAVRIEQVLTAVDTTRHTYTTKQGVVFALRPIPALLIRQLQNNQSGRPQPPVVESAVGPQKKKVKETNVNDPDYLAALQAWEEERQEKFIAYIFSRGVVDDPSEEDQERLREFLPDTSAAMLKYTWILEHMSDDAELGPFAEAIMGQTVPTAGGISQAEERFQRDGEQSADSEISAA